MRTTLAIDDNVLMAAKTLKQLDRRTVGEVLSGRDLARQALGRKVPIVASRLLSSAQVTDSYLLVLAGSRNGHFATLDRRLVVSAVKSGASAHT